MMNIVDDPVALAERCFAPLADDVRWTQFDIRLQRHGSDAYASARQLFGCSVPWWEAQTREGAIPLWFFMRKPPDVRLRFLAGAQADEALTAFAAILDGLVADGAIASAGRGRYHPETARFGGPAAMRAAHALFTLDSSLWWALEVLQVSGMRETAAERLLPALFDALFEQVCASHRDAAWQALARHVVLERPPADLPATVPLPLSARFGAAREQAIVAGYRAGIEAYAAAIAACIPEALARTELAATVAFFMFNRHGFAASRSGPIVAAVLAAHTGS